MADTTSLTSISTSLLRAELAARQDDLLVERPTCGSGANKGAYNTPLHVAALAIILILSTLACSFPIVARRFPRLPIPHRFLFLSRHFGTGVLIATAFVHLLPTAFVSLTDPCLPAFWTDGYPAMAGLVAMLAVLVVVGIEMFFATRGAGHVHGTEYGMVEQDIVFDQDSTHAHGRKKVSGGLRRFRQESMEQDETPYASLGRNSHSEEKSRRRSNSFSKATPPSDQDSELELDDFDEDADPMTHSTSQQERRNRSTDHEAGHHTNGLAIPNGLQNGSGSGTSLTPQEHHEEQKMLLQCLLLEAGILFHSVFIGMALSVATGPPFVVLLVAISFHQTFEGLALGSRIAAITSFGPTSPKPWLMALAYGTTTPIGQAIGLAVHNMYDPASQTGLLMVGMMNAISSGLLLFAGLVELLAEDFLSDKSYQVLQGKKRLQACASVVAGSLLMALVGAWA